MIYVYRALSMACVGLLWIECVKSAGALRLPHLASLPSAYFQNSSSGLADPLGYRLWVSFCGSNGDQSPQV